MNLPRDDHLKFVNRDHNGLISRTVPHYLLSISLSLSLYLSLFCSTHRIRAWQHRHACQPGRAGITMAKEVTMKPKVTRKPKAACHGIGGCEVCFGSLFSFFVLSLSLSLYLFLSVTTIRVCCGCDVLGLYAGPHPAKKSLASLSLPVNCSLSLSLSLCFIAPFSRETPALVKLSGPFSVSNASPYPGNKDKGGEPSPVTQKRTAGQTLPPLG